MARRDLDRAAAELRIGMLVGDDRGQPAGDRMPHVTADDRLRPCVIGMNGDPHVGEHRLAPGSSDMDSAGAVSAQVFEVPEMALDLAGLDLEVADRRLEPGVPVDEAL